MNEIIDFLMQHWPFALLLVVLIGAYAMFEFNLSGDSHQVSAEQAVELFNHQHAVIIDVRTADEFKQGHILGAINISIDELDANLKKLEKYQQKPIVVVCALGKRSSKACKILQNKSFTRAVSLNGGLQSWQAAGLPLTVKD